MSVPTLSPSEHFQPVSGPVFLSPALYDAAAAQGYDMADFRVQEPIPVVPLAPSIWKRMWGSK